MKIKKGLLFLLLVSSCFLSLSSCSEEPSQSEEEEIKYKDPNNFDPNADVYYNPNVKITEPVEYDDPNLWKENYSYQWESFKSDFNEGKLVLEIGTDKISLEKNATYTIPYRIVNPNENYNYSYLTRARYRGCSNGNLYGHASYYVYFESSDNEVASVDSDGNVFPKKEGNCTISVISFNNVKHIDFTVIDKIKINNALTIEDSRYLDYSYKSFNSNKDCLLPKYMQSSGDSNVLVLPIYASNSRKFVKEDEKEKALEKINEVFFGEEKECGWNSVKSFYYKESNGKLNITGKVADWYTVSRRIGYYAYSDDETNLKRINILLENAIDSFFRNNPNESRSDYDRNNDGMFDGVYLVFAANDNYDNGFRSCVTYSTNYMNNAGYSKYSHNNPGYDLFSILSTNALFGINSMKIRQNCKVDPDYHAVHETAHFFGLNDYYVESSSYDNIIYPAGRCNMQDSNDAGHDPYSCLALNWATAIIPNESTTIKLDGFQSSHSVIVLYPDVNKEEYSPFDEYIIIELYTPNELNWFLQDTYKAGMHGPNLACIRVWHVNSILYNSATRSTTSNPTADDVFILFNNTYTDLYYELFMIRNNVNETISPNSTFEYNNSFKVGDTFSLDKFRSQFINDGVLDNYEDLNWSFYIKDIIYTEEGCSAIIDVERTNY